MSTKEMLKGKINALTMLRGYSNYEIAVMNGFVGTEAEWLESLTEQTRMNAAEVITEANRHVMLIESAGTFAKEMVIFEEGKAIAHIQSMAANALNIVQTKGNGETVVMSQKAVSAELSRTAKRITNLEQGLTYDDYFFLDDSVAYIKESLPSAMQYAEVQKIGGMSRKCPNLYSGEDLSFTYSKEITLAKPLKAGTYTLGCVCTSTDTDRASCGVAFLGGGSDGSNITIPVARNSRYTRVVTLGAEVTRIRFTASDSLSYSTNDDATFAEIMINDGETALPYEPYYEGLRDAKVTNVLSNYGEVAIHIPAAVQALEGYGQGNPDDPNEYNSIIWYEDGTCQYSHKGNIVDGAWVALPLEDTTDITDLITSDNLVNCWGDYKITFENEYEYAVPSTIEYQMTLL